MVIRANELALSGAGTGVHWSALVCCPLELTLGPNRDKLGEEAVDKPGGAHLFL